MHYKRAAELILKAKSSDTYQKLLMKLKATSYQEIIGMSTKELPHSNMLAWIFNRRDLNNAPQSPMNLLLRLIAYKARVMSEDLGTPLSLYCRDEKMLSDIILDKLRCENVRCLREDANLSCDVKGRADIIMEASASYLPGGEEKDILLVIENKINTKESSDQCRRYHDAYSNRKIYEGYEKFFVYLAPEVPGGYGSSNASISSVASNGLSSEHFIIVTYQELYDYVLRPLWMFRKLFSDETVNMLESYINTLTNLKDFSNSTVMDKETKDLLSQFFEENKDLIIAAVQTSQDDDLIENIAVAVNNNATRTRYAVSHGGKKYNSLSRAGVFEEVVRRLVSLNMTYSAIDSIFKDAGLGSNNLSNVQDKKNYKDPIVIENATWYMNVNKWTIEAFDNLLKLVKANPEWRIDVTQEK